LVPSINCVDLSIVNSDSKAINPQVIVVADTKELTYQIYKIATMIKREGMIIDFMH
jgi:superfamily II DNA/RNA helicase